MCAASRPGASTSWSSRSGCGSRGSEVSRICAQLDEQVEAFRQRPLEGDYPYLWLDAKVEKVRDGGRVVRKCLGARLRRAPESGYRSRRACGASCTRRCSHVCRLRARSTGHGRSSTPATCRRRKAGPGSAVPRRSRPSGCQAPCPGRRPRSPARLVGDACEPQRCHAVAPPRRCGPARARSYRSSAPAANAADRRPWLRP